METHNCDTIDNGNDYLHLKSTIPVHKVFLRGDGAFQKALLTPFFLEAFSEGCDQRAAKEIG